MGLGCTVLDRAGLGWALNWTGQGEARGRAGLTGLGNTGRAEGVSGLNWAGVIQAGQINNFICVVPAPLHILVSASGEDRTVCLRCRCERA